MKKYPDLGQGTFADVTRVMDFAVRERKTDVSDFDNLNNRFIAGRKTGRIPTGASDVGPLDKVGDFNIANDGTTTYIYALVNIAGTATWQRVAMSGW